jgi:hypothetical protein
MSRVARVERKLVQLCSAQGDGLRKVNHLFGQPGTREGWQL